MAVSDWSTTASSNTVVGAIGIDEGCSPGVINNAIREVMKQIADWRDGAIAAKAALVSPTFTGTPAAPTATAGTNTTQLATTAFVSAAIAVVGASSAPSGCVVMHAASTAPAGWLECSGAAVSRTTYAALFAVIGTTFGTGDGSTTFNLPQLQGEFVRGYDNGRGVDSGRAFGSAQASQTGQHSHSYGYPINGGSGQPGGSGGSTTTGTTGTSGGTENGSETRPRNISLLYIIKT